MDRSDYPPGLERLIADCSDPSVAATPVTQDMIEQLFKEIPEGGLWRCASCEEDCPGTEILHVPALGKLVCRGCAWRMGLRVVST